MYIDRGIINTDCTALAVMAGPNNTLLEFSGATGGALCPTLKNGLHSLPYYTDAFSASCDMNMTGIAYNNSWTPLSLAWGNIGPTVAAPPQQDTPDTLTTCMANAVNRKVNHSNKVGLIVGLSVSLPIAALIVVGCCLRPDVCTKK